MRRLSCLVVLLAGMASGLSGCASTPSYPISLPYDQSEAQLRELRNAQARVQLARTTLDLDKDADSDDLQEFWAARDALSRLQSLYPTLDPGTPAPYHPLAIPGYRPGRNWTSASRNVPGPRSSPARYTEQRLSGLPGG